MTATYGPAGPSDLVERYLGRLVDHDFQAVSECLADGVVRTGPFGDVYEGRERYVAFLADLMPTLPGYAMELHRIRAVASADPENGSPATVLVELTETVALDGEPIDTAEVLLFDIDGDLLITRITIYIQRA